MAVYKDKVKDNRAETWRVVYRYIDWTGEKKQTQKRGFKTKREALAWEREQLCKKGKELYEVKPFSVKTITTERIFIDKLFAAEAYVRKSDAPHRAFEAAKHIYDLAVLSTKPVISNLISDQYQIGYLLKIRLNEELERRDGIPGILPKDFLFFTESENNFKVKSAYDIMQKQYILRESDCIPYETAMCSLKKIKEELEKNPSWIKCNIPKREKSHDDFER